MSIHILNKEHFIKDLVDNYYGEEDLLLKVMDILDLKIHKVDFTEDYIVSIVKRNGEIYLKNDLSLNQRRYVLSHCIGHYLYHSVENYVDDMESVFFPTTEEDLLCDKVVKALLYGVV